MFREFLPTMEVKSETRGGKESADLWKNSQTNVKPKRGHSLNGEYIRREGLCADFA